jgi:hypothetical protein
MKEPKRLLSHGATDFERQLLRAVVSERPSALLRSRMQRGLGLVGPLAWASNVKALLGTVTSRATVGVAVVGVVVAGSFAAVRLLPNQGSNDPAPAEAPQPTASAVASPTNRAPAASAPAALSPAAPSPAALSPAALPPAALPPSVVPAGEPSASAPSGASSSTAAPNEARPAPAAPSVPSTNADDDSRLREEIALLDTARAALQRADREGARSTLRAYRERFPNGILRREAKVLWTRAEGKTAPATDD